MMPIKIKSGLEGCACEVGRDCDVGCRVVIARHLSPRPRRRRDPIAESNAAEGDPASIVNCIEEPCSLADPRLMLLHCK